MYACMYVYMYRYMHDNLSSYPGIDIIMSYAKSLFSSNSSLLSCIQEAGTCVNAILAEC